MACLIVLASACAPKAPPATSATGPRYPDFVYPSVPAQVGDERLRSRNDLAWRYLQAGDLPAAAREYADVLKRAPAFYPAEVGLGYVLVAQTQFKDALSRFERALRRAPGYAPALAGQGEALAATGQVEQAIASFEAARAADATLTDLARRVEALRFGRINGLVAAGARAAAAGRLDEARRAYEQALAIAPGSAMLYRDLGVVEARAGAVDAAIAHLEQAVRLDADDARAWVALAEAYERKGAYLEAVSALERALSADPSDDIRKSLERVRARADLERLPAEYRALGSASQITRGDLAALLGVQVLPLLPPGRPQSGVVVTDVRAHWAASWILGVTRAGIMDAYPNHTFQPGSAVRRVDLALAVSRVISAMGIPLPMGDRRERITDVPADHLNYRAVASAVASGVMSLQEGGAFRPSRPVSGREAIETIGRLETLARRARATRGR